MESEEDVEGYEMDATEPSLIDDIQNHLRSSMRIYEYTHNVSVHFKQIDESQLPQEPIDELWVKLPESVSVFFFFFWSSKIITDGYKQFKELSFTCNILCRDSSNNYSCWSKCNCKV